MNVIVTYVLVVEDDPTLCSLLGMMLTSAGFAVRLARRGEDAVTLAKSASFDVLLTDYSLPDLSGVEVMRAVRAIRPAMKCIVLTGYSNAAEMRQSGFDVHLTKPCDMDELAAAVRSVVPRAA